MIEVKHICDICKEEIPAGSVVAQNIYTQAVLNARKETDDNHALPDDIDSYRTGFSNEMELHFHLPCYKKAVKRLLINTK